MGQYTVKHQCDDVCADCDNYYIDNYSGVEKCVAGHDERVGRHVLACDDFTTEGTEDVSEAKEE